MSLDLGLVELNKKHFNGNPCVKCGETLRYVKGGVCVACSSRESRARHAANPHRYDVRAAELRSLNPERMLLQGAKQRAKKMGREFSLTLSDITIPVTCPVLGIPIMSSPNRKTNNSPSLDRFDNSKGYTKDNVNVISIRANMIKRDATVDEIVKIAAYMTAGQTVVHNESTIA